MPDTLLTVKPVNTSILQLKETSNILPSKRKFVFELISTTGNVREVLNIPVQDIIIPAEMSAQEKNNWRLKEVKNLYHSIHEFFYILEARLPSNYESLKTYQADDVQNILDFIAHGHLYHYEVSQWGQEFYYYNNFDVDAVDESVRFFLSGVNEGKNHIILHIGTSDTKHDLVLSVAPLTNKCADWIYSTPPNSTKYEELRQLIAGHTKMTMSPESLFENFQTWAFRDTRFKPY